MKYTFEEKGHKHLLDGKRATGVTTILGVIAKPALIGWAAKMASEYIEEEVKKLTSKDNFIEELGNEWARILLDARQAHRRKKEDAGQKGTDVHAEVEGIINFAMSINGIIPKDFVYGTNYPISEDNKKQIQHFIGWAINNKVKFLESEKSVWSEKLFCAGICDFVCEINGEKLVGDLKTSKAIYPEYLYQVGAYRMLLEEMGERDFKGSVIVRLGKDGKFNEDEDVVISYGYEEEKEAFLSALKLYRITNNFKTKNRYSKAL